MCFLSSLSVQRSLVGLLRGIAVFASRFEVECVASSLLACVVDVVFVPLHTGSDRSCYTSQL
jgi:hypothetical protein